VLLRSRRRRCLPRLPPLAEHPCTASNPPPLSQPSRRERELLLWRLLAVIMPSEMEAGLQSLGLYLHTDRAVFHTWAAAFPKGHFDGHQSILPAPDHLVFHGMARKLVSALFFMLSEPLRNAVEASLRDCLRAALLRRTRVYNPKTRKINGLTISEWAAVLTVAPTAFSRVLCQPAHSPLLAPISLGLELLELLRDWTVKLYYYPRVSLDGVAACRVPRGSNQSASQLHRFMNAVVHVCERLDCVLLKRALDVPNLHRLWEVEEVVSPRGGGGHVRHFSEMSLEGAHQLLKRAISRGNGQDDAGHAMRQTQLSEFFSRLALEPSAFGVPPSWMAHAGVKRAMASALPLWSQPSAQWAVGNRMSAGDVPDGALVVAPVYTRAGATITWYNRASRGDEYGLRLGDAVSVLVSGVNGRTAVNVAGQLHDADERLAFFRVVALFSSSPFLPCAIVQPLVCVGDGGDVHALREDSFLFLKMRTNVRRALAMHNCSMECVADEGMSCTTHSEKNEWVVLSRSRGYPARSS